MTTIQIYRCYLLAIPATLGVLYVDGLAVCYTIELPYVNNQRNVSSIPVGTYKAKVVKGHPRLGDCIEILNVPNRQGIFIHVANSVKEIRGCIAPNLHLTSFITGAESKEAMKRIFNSMIDDRNIEVQIKTASEFFHNK